MLFVKKQHPSNDQHFHHIAHKYKYFFKVFHPQFFSGHSIEKKVRIIARITLGRCIPNGILILSPVFFPGRDFMQRMLLRSRPLHNSVSTKWAEYSDTAARFLHLSNTRWRSRYQCEILRAARKYKLPRRCFLFCFYSHFFSARRFMLSVTSIRFIFTNSGYTGWENWKSINLLAWNIVWGVSIGLQTFTNWNLNHRARG